MGLKSTLIGTMVILIGAGIAASFILRNDKEATIPSIYIPNRVEIHDGVMKKLQEYPQIMSLEDVFLTIGPGSGVKTWSVRGTFKKENRNIPFFTFIQHTCVGSDVAGPCWTLNELIIDGQPVATSGPQSSLSANEDQSNLQVENRSASMTGAAAGEAQTGSEQKPETTSSTNEPDMAALEQEAAVRPRTPNKDARIWRTRTDNVNARSGPSLDSDVVFKMSSDVPLTLVEEQSPWGLFEYPAANGQTGRVWIHMNVVEAAGE